MKIENWKFKVINLTFKLDFTSKLQVLEFENNLQRTFIVYLVLSIELTSCIEVGLQCCEFWQNNRIHINTVAATEAKSQTNFEEFEWQWTHEGPILAKMQAIMWVFGKSIAN